MDPNTPPATPPLQTPPPAATQVGPEKPEEWKLIVTILALFFFTPLGIIFMWMWMKNWPKWLKILITVLPILFLILWIVLFAAIFVALLKNPPAPETQTPVIVTTPIPASGSASESAQVKDWKTYQNAAYGFSFKYPSSWFEHPESSKSATQVLQVSFSKKDIPASQELTSGDRVPVGLQIFSTPLDQFLLKNPIYNKNGQEIQIDGNRVVKTKQLLDSPSNPGMAETIAVNLNKYTLLFSGTNSKNDPVPLDLIISSFKFTK